MIAGGCQTESSHTQPGPACVVERPRFGRPKVNKGRLEHHLQLSEELLGRPSVPEPLVELRHSSPTYAPRHGHPLSKNLQGPLHRSSQWGRPVKNAAAVGIQVDRQNDVQDAGWQAGLALAGEYGGPPGAQYEVEVEDSSQWPGLRLGPHPQGCCVRSSSSDDPAEQAVVGKLFSSIAGAGPAVELLGKSPEAVGECIEHTDPPFTLYFVDAAGPDHLTGEPPATVAMGTVSGLEPELSLIGSVELWPQLRDFLVKIAGASSERVVGAAPPAGLNRVVEPAPWLVGKVDQVPSDILRDGTVVVDQLAEQVLSKFEDCGVGVPLDGPLLDAQLEFLDLCSIKQHLDLSEFADIAAFVYRIRDCVLLNPALVALGAEWASLPAHERGTFPDSPDSDHDIVYAVHYCFLLNVLCHAMAFEKASDGLVTLQCLVSKLQTGFSEMANSSKTGPPSRFATMKAKAVMEGIDAMLAFKRKPMHVPIKTAKMNVSLNIMMAVYQDVIDGSVENAATGMDLLLGLWFPSAGCTDLREWSDAPGCGIYDSGAAHPHSWVNLYQTWNMSFCSNLDNSIAYFAKLLAPAVSGTYHEHPGTYLYFRVLCLAVHVLWGMQCLLKHDPMQSVWKNEGLTQRWGTMNRVMARAYFNQCQGAFDHAQHLEMCANAFQRSIRPAVSPDCDKNKCVETATGLLLAKPEPIQSQNITLVHQFREWCRLQPDKVLYSWLDEQGDPARAWSYCELETRANAVCHALLHNWKCHQGDRAALMYLPGLEFIAAFWGCLFAGVVAVPVYPVDLRGDAFERSVERFGRIAAACQLKLVLSHGEYLEKKLLHAVKNMFGRASWPEGLEFEATDGLEQRVDCRIDHQPGLDELAFLQFTSGSTGDPKGVMVSHGNLADNCEQMRISYQYNDATCAVSWLPQYHDMGLIGMITGTVGAGGSLLKMSPATFIHSPLLWLQTMSAYKATHSAAPNFAYGLCLKKTDMEARHKLDLNHVVMLMNASEAVYHETVTQFVAGFAVAGVRSHMINPGYGLAEHTIFVCCAHTNGVQLEPVITKFDEVQLNVHHHALRTPPDAPQSKSVCLVSSGTPLARTSIRIAQQLDSGELVHQADGHLGEICVSSPSKAQGYWDKPELSRDTFQATIQYDPTGTEYLRTGDLGFIHEGELYVFGRLKDLIIVRGKNYYPQDIEQSAERNLSLRPGCSASFSVDVGGEEAAVLVAEVRGEPRETELKQIMSAVYAAISTDHQLHCHAILLLKARTILKTTSGKIRRKACKQGFLDWQQQQQQQQAVEADSAVGLFGRVVDWVTSPGSGDASSLLHVVASWFNDNETVGADNSAMTHSLNETGGAHEYGITPDQSKIETRIATVGCGIADLTCALGLSQAGYNTVSGAPEQTSGFACQMQECGFIREAIGHIKQTVLRQVQLVTGQVDLAADHSLLSRGLSSVKATEVAASLSESLKLDLGVSAVELPASLLLEHSTVSEVAAFLASQISIGNKRSIEPSRLEISKGSTGPPQAEQHIRPIRIAGMSCSLAGGTDSPDQLWSELLTRDCHVTSSVPSRCQLTCPSAGRTIAGSFFGPDLDAVLTHSHGGFPTRQVSHHDMHIQLLLDTSLRALTDAGLVRATLASQAMGVFTGSQPIDFMTWCPGHMVARALASALKVTGPRQNFDMACSSGYLATHHAMEALKIGHCPAGALVSGASLLLKPDSALEHHTVGILSPSGRMRPYDQAADGMVYGETSGALVLLPEPFAQDVKARKITSTLTKGSTGLGLRIHPTKLVVSNFRDMPAGEPNPGRIAVPALKQGDHIVAMNGARVQTQEQLKEQLARSGPTVQIEVERDHCKLVASAANYNSALSPAGLVDRGLVRQAAETTLVEAGIGPERLAMCHPHAMGSPTADTPELVALLGRHWLSSSMDNGRTSTAGQRQPSLVLVGHKANYGHSLCAAGLVSVVVSTLALRHRMVPVHLGVTNPLAILQKSKDRVLLPVKHPAELEQTGMGIHGSINGHSISGDNVHLMLELDHR